MSIDIIPALALAIVGIGLGAALSAYFTRAITPSLAGIAIGLAAGCVFWFLHAGMSAQVQRKTRDIYCWKWDQVGLVIRDLKRLEEVDQLDLVKQKILLLDREFTNTFYDDARFDRLLERLDSKSNFTVPEAAAGTQPNLRLKVQNSAGPLPSR